MTAYYLLDNELSELLRARPSATSFAPVTAGENGWLAPLEPDRPVELEALRRPRCVQSPKGFFLPASESVGRYGPKAAAEAPAEAAPLVLLGVRACGLRAREYLDRVMTGKEFDDPAYRARREATTIVSCDCIDCAETCCCTLVGGAPYPTEGYDINLSPADDGWVVDVATEKGKALLGAREFTKAGPGHLNRRDQVRQRMVERLKKQNRDFSFAADDTSQPALPEGGDECWQQFAADCVECGACTHICPTCHCFYLYDQLLGPEAFERVRTWDSCLLSSYHRMAGGADMKLTPRPKLFSRLANRVLHKFTYSPQQYEMLGCVGCGRCIDACLGAIDIRQVVQALGAPCGEPAK